ncbi:MAG: trigger factor family protein [Bacteroidales bacterium]|jgi:trigger factor|nr:trigger factor family protein [Bacteroidales bacterium]
MQIVQEKTNAGTVLLELLITREDLIPKVDKVLRDYQRKANIPGFRPGKVPFGMVKKMYGDVAMVDELNKYVSESLNNYFVENKINIIGYPLPDMDKTKKIDLLNDTEYRFFFEIGLSPEVDVKLEQLHETYYVPKVEEQEVQEAIDQMLAENPDIIYPKTVEKEDQLELLVTQADAEGNEVEYGFETVVTLFLSDASEATKTLFENKLLGDEFIVNFEQLEGTDKAKELLELNEDQAGLVSANFNTIIDEISREVKPILNEDFYERMYPNAGIITEEDFRANVIEEIERHWNAQCEIILFNSVIDRLINKSQIELPDAFMKKWMIDRADGKITEEEAEAELEKTRTAFHLQLIEQSLKTNYPDTIDVSSQEIRNFVRAYFHYQFVGMAELPKEVDDRLDPIIDKILSDENEVFRIERDLTEKKMKKLFNEKVTKVEEIISTSELKKIIEKQNQIQEETIDE